MTSAINMRDTALLAGAVVLGGVIAPSFALVGIPMAAAGLSVLIGSGHVTPAAFAAGLAVAFGAFLAPAYAVLLVPVFVALLFGIVQLRTRSALQVVSVFTLIIAVSSLGADVVRAWWAGTTLLLLRTELVTEALAAATQVAMLDAEGVFGMEGPALVDLMVRLWPADYFTTAVLTSVLAVGAVGWAAKRTGHPTNRLPALADLDVSPHVLWAFITGLLLLAGARVYGGVTSWIFAAGVNLLIMVRLPLMAQGLGVAAGLYRKLGLGRLGRYTGYALLVLIELFAPVVSMIGLADFWVNFRKLPRDQVDTDRVESFTDGD